MNLNIQMQLKNNPLYLEYLHNHSYWYKELNRYPEKFKDFIDEMKLLVVTADGQQITVTRDNIVGLNDSVDYLIAKKKSILIK